MSEVEEIFHVVDAMFEKFDAVALASAVANIEHSTEDTILRMVAQRAFDIGARKVGLHTFEEMIKEVRRLTWGEKV